MNRLWAKQTSLFKAQLGVFACAIDERLLYFIYFVPNSHFFPLAC